MSKQQANNRSMNVSYKEPALPRSSLVIWIVCIGLAIFLTWAWLFNLEEVSTGTGKVIPSSKEQTIQSLEGGILTKLNVQEGDIVQKGEILAQLDQTRFASNVGESKSLLTSAQATAARLRAEVNGTPLAFPAEVLKEPKLVKEETALYYSRRENLEQSLAGYQQALQLVQQELMMTEPLVAKGAASEVEVLRLKREANDLRNKMNDTRNQYYVKAREELSKANTDIETQQQVVMGRSD
ncbi:MAG: biotin/lipoyl-binding protein, partial [Acinetobacter junii]